MNNPRWEDLIADPSFQNFVLGNVPEDVQYWTQWLVQHPERREDVAEAKAFLQQIDLPEVDVPESYREIDRQKLLTRLPTTTLRRNLRPVWMAAATVLLLVAAGLWWGQQDTDDPWIALQSNGMQTVRLPDGSEVTMNQAASLRYARVWDNNAVREVWLEGEAWFDVQDFPSAGRRKFVVHLPESDIEVLGTEFNVRQEAGKLDVVLASGNIRFLAEQDTIQMQPGEHLAKLSGQSPQLTRKVNVQKHTIWKEQELNLDGMTIQEMVAWIHAKHGLRLQFADSVGTELELSGSLPADDPALLLETLSELLDLKMTQTDTLVQFYRTF